MKRFMTFLVLATLVGLFYVYAEVEAVKTGYRIRRQEEAKAAALDRGRTFQYHVAHLKSPQSLEKTLLWQRVKLESPKLWQTLVLPGEGGSKKSAGPRPLVGRPNFFGKFLVGTARAEAKESSR